MTCVSFDMKGIAHTHIHTHTHGQMDFDIGQAKIGTVFFSVSRNKTKDLMC